MNGPPTAAALDRRIAAMLSDSLDALRGAVDLNARTLAAAAEMLTTCLASGHKILVFGNGGSAADSQHIAAEFVNRFRIERPPLAAIALTTDSSILTSIGNDYAFEDIFEKQVMAIGQTHDVAWGISTSGRSANVLKAVARAERMGLRTLAMTGPGGPLADGAELALRVPAGATARIQEAHILMAHMLCELVEWQLFPGADAP